MIPPNRPAPGPASPYPNDVENRRRRVVRWAAALLLLAAPTGASAVEAAPLTSRDGVVVSWLPGSRTAVVVTANNRAYVVHALRRFMPGTRVRVNGIKWGTPVSGIKWGIAPRGVKWGIKLARNGTYQSGLTVVRGRARITSLRGTVMRRYGRNAVAVSLPGATIVLPVARGAVWLPAGGRRTHAVTPVGLRGSTSVFRIRFTPAGRPVVTGATQIAPPVSGALLQFAGAVRTVDPVAGRMTVQASPLARFPLVLTLTVPRTLDVSGFPPGTQVAGTMIAVDGGRTLVLTGLTRNDSFAAADSPAAAVGVATVPVASTGGAAPAWPAVQDPECLVQSSVAPPAGILATAALRARWTAGRDGGLIRNVGLATSQANRLDTVGRCVQTGNPGPAIAELLTFESVVDHAQPGQIDAAFRAEMLAASAGLRATLSAA